MPSRPVPPTRSAPPIRTVLRPERPGAGSDLRRARFLLTIEATKPAPGERHLVVALDRSSSMRGKPLADAVLALRTLVRAAPDGTRLSVLTFDGSIQRLLPPTLLAERSRPLVLARLEGIECGKWTDHSAALLAGFALGNEAGGAAHLLLLTDGYASRGLCGLDQLVELVRHGAGRTTLSTLGLSDDAEGWVLGALARTGGGIYQHAPDSRSIEPAIGAELGLLEGLHAAQVEVRFRPAPGVSLRKLYHRGPAWRDGDARVLRLPRLVHGEPLEVAFELEREPGASDAAGGPGASAGDAGGVAFAAAASGADDASAGDGGGGAFAAAARWGMVEVRAVTPAGRETRHEVPMDGGAGRAGSSGVDAPVAAAILRHRVGVAILDACTAQVSDARRAAAWLRGRLRELQVLATEYQLDDAALRATFARAALLQRELDDAAEDGEGAVLNGLIDLAEICTRGIGSVVDPSPQSAALATRINGIRTMTAYRDD